MPRLITDLAVMLLTAGVVAIIFKKIKQPMVLGYILAGFLVGPYMPYFFSVVDKESIDTWSEIGIIVLMFGLGLEFNLHKLFSTGKTAIVTALTEVLGMLLVGFLIGHAMGWGNMDSLFLGGMLSMSSTTIIIKAFDELNVKKESFAQLVFGILVIEDIAGIFMMIILSTVSVSKNISGIDLTLQLAQLVLYLMIWLILGIFILPTILKKTQDFLNDETLLLLSLGICFGMVLLAEELGFSSALGAFLAGSLMAGTVHAERTEHLTSGIKDLFGAVFFLSVGMLLDPKMIIKYLVPILIITLVTIFGKIAISTLGVILSGQNLKKAVKCGCCLGQIGEFAFIIASLGMSLGVIEEYLYPIIVSVSVITTLTTPAFIKGSDKLYSLLIRLLPEKIAGKLNRYTLDESDHEEDSSDWQKFIVRYVKITAIYGALMLGVAAIVNYLIYPALKGTGVNIHIVRILCIVIIFIGDALFIRPMLDTHSTEYTTLWVSDSRNHLPLITFTVVRFMLMVLNIFIAVQGILSIDAFWMIPIIIIAAIVVYKSGWMASAYISAETRFLANFNERSLDKNKADVIKTLGAEIYVLKVTCNAEDAGQTLKQLSWGRVYNANVIRIEKKQKVINMPSGNVQLLEGDRILLVGKADDLRTLSIKLGQTKEILPTLQEYIDSQEGDDAAALFTYVIPVEQDSELQGKSIRTSNLRNKYDCMILGIQRDKLPVLQPDVNMQLQTDDMIWILGSRKMAERLMAEESFAEA